MLNYIFIGKNLKGKTILGKYKGSGIQDFLEYCHDKGIFVGYHFEIKAFNQWIRKKVTYKDLVIICKQFGVLIRSGIPICEVLRLMALQVNSKQMAISINHIRNEILEGRSVKEAFENSIIRFPNVFINMINIAEESGKMDEVLLELSDYFEKERELTKKIKGVLSYPLIVLILTIVVLLFLSFFIMPSFIGNLQSLGGEIPKITLAIILISNIIKNYSLYMIMFIILAFIITGYFANKHKDKVSLYSILIFIPILRKLYGKYFEVNFTNMLRIMTLSGVSIVNTLNVCKSSFTDPFIKNVIGKMIKCIENGYLLSEAMEASYAFNPILISMIEIGEESGQLEEMLLSTTEILKGDLETLLGKITDMIQPITILIMGVIVALLCAAMVLPMFSIYDSIS